MLPTILVLCLAVVPCTSLPNDWSDAVSRHKRNAGGEDACMQIYTVPKRTVKCDPSDEVQEALDTIQTSIVDHAESIQGLGARIDELDPNKEKELPEEVQ